MRGVCTQYSPCACISACCTKRADCCASKHRYDVNERHRRRFKTELTYTSLRVSCSLRFDVVRNTLIVTRLLAAYYVRLKSGTSSHSIRTYHPMPVVETDAICGPPGAQVHPPMPITSFTKHETYMHNRDFFDEACTTISFVVQNMP